MRRFSAGDTDFAGGEYECRSAWFTDAHDDGRESTGVEFGVTASECNLFEIESFS